MINQREKINILSKDVSALLAAGQVIDSIEAVVRELVENSLDAGANRIFVSLWPEAWRIQVSDNGCGMSLRDLRLACAPHGTSKINSEADLHQIRTLGFRGEALYSLAQLADLEILSRPHHSDSCGWKISYENGKNIGETEVAIAPGTIITVRNLFSNWQIRREVLANTSKQLKRLQTMIAEMSLCHPQVNWQIRIDNRVWLKISPSENSLGIIPQVIKQVNSSDVAYKEFEIPPHGEISQEKIALILGLPDRCHRQRPDWIKVAVNGRVVKSQPLEQSILSTTARILPTDRYPLCFIHLQISPQQIDWNRHPAKSEIYIQSTNFYQTQIKETIEQLLRLNADYLTQSGANHRVKQLFKVAEVRENYGLNQDISKSHQNSSTSLELIALTAVAQVNKTYIVVEHEQGLWLVEQHIAHERVLYEQLQDDWQLVSLDKPIILNQLREREIAQLEKLGIQVESFGEQLWAVRNAPAMLVKREDCADALLELSQGGDLQGAQVATACRSAIRNGTTMTLIQMQDLINQWKVTRNPLTCPHGRPIYLSLEESALARFFRRHWVIGKSHGI